MRGDSVKLIYSRYQSNSTVYVCTCTQYVCVYTRFHVHKCMTMYTDMRVIGRSLSALCDYLVGGRPIGSLVVEISGIPRYLLFTNVSHMVAEGFKWLIPIKLPVITEVNTVL